MVSRAAHVISLIAVLAVHALAQNRLTLREAGARKEESFAPLHDGETITVQGIVASRPIPVLGYRHLVIHDGDGNGLTLEGDDSTLTSLQPGDEIEVEGTLFNRAGLPVLLPIEIRKVGVSPVPEPLRSSVAEANSFVRLGTLIAIESWVVGTNETSAGQAVLLGGYREPPIRVFYPGEARAKGGNLSVRPGDRVRVVGLSSQYCPNPPHDRGFQLVIGDSSAFSLTRNWMISPDLLVFLLLTVAGTLGFWWLRERSMAVQRKRMRAMTHVAEEVISAGAISEISQKLTSELPQILRAHSVHLYLYNRSNESLDRIPTPTDPEPFSISIDTPIGRMSSGVVLCFRNRAMLHVPDTRKSPVLQGADDDEIPRSAIFVPMFAQHEQFGVLTVEFNVRLRRLHADEQAALQHLANQVATSLRLLEQSSVREQLMRTEKMAAAGQLISGVVTELRAPLEAIERSAAKLLSTRIEPQFEVPLREMLDQAGRGADIVNRLVSFAKAEQKEAKPLNLYTLLSDLMDLRATAWQEKSVQARNSLPREPAIVLGDQSQLKQALLNVLVHAEQSLSGHKDKTIDVSSSIIAGRVLVAIDHSDRSQHAAGADPFAGHGQGEAFGLQFCRALINSHGGEIRLLRNLSTGARFEITLPLHHAHPASSNGHSKRRPSQPLTVLVVEPDFAAQRKLISVLGSRGHRAVPAASSEQAIDLIQRLRFDAAFCSVRLPGLNWVELYERIRRRIGAFVLLAEGYDSDVLRTFKGGEGYVLSKPIEEDEAEVLLSKIEARHEGHAYK